jgi:hypothetical protein
VIWFLPVLEKLTTIIYEIVIILVKLQTDYRYPNSHFFRRRPSYGIYQTWEYVNFQLESFKYKLKQHYYKNAKPPSYYNIGNRYLNILHTRIRNNCSALHNDLFHANLIHSPSCSCGYSTENAEHFLLYSKRFDAQRNILYRSLLAANVHIDLNTLLFGSQIYNIDTNRHVFITVQTYIKETCRFSFR